jgi:hypothetical protein
LLLVLPVLLVLLALLACRLELQNKHVPVTAEQQSPSCLHDAKWSACQGSFGTCLSLSMQGKHPATTEY